MTKPKMALNPKHPERVCWGCDLYCPADDLRCGNGTIRTQHPSELFGEDWIQWDCGLMHRNVAKQELDLLGMGNSAHPAEQEEKWPKAYTISDGFSRFTRQSVS